MSRRTRIGLLLTSIWALAIAIVVYVYGRDARNLELNQWGDFFAGAVAPMAFLWLILGYFQQSEELKQNTEALILQAKELEQSVVAQKGLVEATSQQVALMKEAYERQRRQDSNRAQLRLRVVTMTCNNRGAGVTAELRLKNIGHSVSQVSVSTSDGFSVSDTLLPHFDYNQEIGFVVKYAADTDITGWMQFDYIDGLDRPSKTALFLSVVKNDLKISFSPQEM
jgi:hypothetical protein